MRGSWGNRIHILINIVVWVLCIYSLYVYFRDVVAEGIWIELSACSVCIVVAQAIIVNLIKSLRLYLILFDNRTAFSHYIVMYAETSIVNLLLPYKSGELYRGYRVIRQEMSSVIQGYAVVFFDRFIDTLALISTVLFMALFWHVSVPAIFVIFIVFCVMFMFLYCLFPPLYKYMNHFMIYNRSSGNTLRGLYALKLCNRAYKAVNEMVRGRFLFLYILSVLAWFTEIGGLIIVEDSVRDGIADYMLAAMFIAPSKEYMVYFFVCIVIFALLSASVRIGGAVRRKIDGNTHSL